MSKNTIVAVALVISLTVLAVAGVVPGAAVLTFLGGLFLERPSLGDGSAE